MKHVSGKSEDKTLTIFLSGTVNSANAAEIEAEIEKLTREYTGDKVIIDAEGLEYISSAGLRIILRLKNQHDALAIINTSSAVYEVFEMTGFTEMLTVEKAYRKLSVDGCEVIGQGANGVVYRLDDDTIIKVYRNPDSLPEIKRERELARKAFVLGIPTAIPYDVVKVGDGYGSVFELLNAKSFAKLLVAEPENTDTYVGLYVDTLKKLHATAVKPDDMPNKKEDAMRWVEFLKGSLPDEQIEKLKRLVSDVPVKLTMLHGDYHIKNIMMQNGEVLLIDMDTLSYGHPIFELAQMYNAYIGFGEYDHAVIYAFLGLPFETTSAFWHKVIRAYFNTDDADTIRAIEDKIKVISYVKVIRRTLKLENDETKLAFYKNKLSEVLARTESLEFGKA